MGISSYKTSSIEFVGTAAGIPASAPEGQLYYETDNNQFDLYEDGGWKWFSPPIVGLLAARPDATYAHQGRIFIATDTDQIFIKETTGSSSAWVEIGSYGAWTSWFPTFTQSNSGLTGTLSYGRYKKEGRMVTCAFYKNFATGVLGVTNNTIFIPNASLPFDPVFTNGGIIGVGQAYAKIGGTQYSVQLVMTGTGSANGTTLRLLRTDTTIANYFGVDPNVAIINGDALGGTFTYEAVS